MKGRDRLLTLIVVLAFLWAGFTQWLRLEPVLGAFAIGILFGQMRRLPSDVSHKLEAAALAIFSPIFFAVAGLKVDIPSLANPRLFGLALVVIGVATFGKVIGAYLGSRYLSKQDHWTSLAYRSWVERPRGGRDHRCLDRTVARHPVAGSLLDDRGDGRRHIAGGSLCPPGHPSANRTGSRRDGPAAT